MKPPHELDVFADVALAYRPEAQQKKSGKRKKRAAKKAAKKHAQAMLMKLSESARKYFGDCARKGNAAMTPAQRKDDLVRCESCGQMSCLGHAQRHSDGDICFGCRDKELSAMSVCCYSLADLTDLMVQGRISGAAAAQKMFEIAKTLENWDV